MNYQKLWNDLKDQMVSASEIEAAPGGNYEDYLFHASAILRRMVIAEVDECRKIEEQQKELDLKLVKLLFKNEEEKGE